MHSRQFSEKVLAAHKIRNKTHSILQLFNNFIFKNDIPGQDFAGHFQTREVRAPYILKALSYTSFIVA